MSFSSRGRGPFEEKREGRGGREGRNADESGRVQRDAHCSRVARKLAKQELLYKNDGVAVASIRQVLRAQPRNLGNGGCVPAIIVREPRIITAVARARARAICILLRKSVTLRSRHHDGDCATMSRVPRNTRDFIFARKREKEGLFNKASASSALDGLFDLSAGEMSVRETVRLLDPDLLV